MTIPSHFAGVKATNCVIKNPLQMGIVASFKKPLQITTGVGELVGSGLGVGLPFTVGLTVGDGEAVGDGSGDCAHSANRDYFTARASAAAVIDLFRGRVVIPRD